MSDQILQTLELTDSPDGGSTTETYDSDISTNLEMPDNPDTVQVLEGYDRRRGYRKEINFQVLDPDAHANLAPLMKNRNDVKVTATWKNGSTTVVEGFKVQVTPLTSVVPDNVSVWYDTDTGATDNPGNEGSNTSDSSWTELSEPLGNIDENHEILSRENARGLPFYIAGVVEYTIPMFYDSTALSNLRTEDNNENEIRIAVETQSGNYLVLGDQSGGGVEVEVHQMPAPSPDEVNHFVATVYQSGALDDIITFPSGANNLFYGAEVSGAAFAHSETAIVTENR